MFNIEKAITVHQPFAQLLVTGEKTIETRTWKYEPKFRGWVAVHAGKAWNEGLRALHTLLMQGGSKLPAISAVPRSAIIGAVRIRRARRLLNSKSDMERSFSTLVPAAKLPQDLLRRLFNYKAHEPETKELETWALEIDRAMLFDEFLFDVSGQLGFWGLYEYQREFVAKQAELVIDRALCPRTIPE